MDQILFRNEIQAFPVIGMPSGRIQFQQWITRSEDQRFNIQQQQQYDDQQSLSPVLHPVKVDNRMPKIA